ncbi:MAG: tetratricopeptide repeat protein [Candidatus Hydrogenedentes bacterium]|nr:tetratricopeptide repeat protein [Candidatus Hydrogenedentota bacterium]
MSRKAFIAVAVFLLLVILLGVSALGAFRYWPQYRSRQFLASGQASFDRGEWLAAKRQFAWYLISNEKDVAVLEKYIDACLKLPLNRPKTLTDAGKAMFKVASLPPYDMEKVRRVLHFDEQHGLFVELEYAASYLQSYFPDETEIMYYRAKALDRLGRGSEARELFEKLLPLKTAPGDEYGRLAYWLHHAGQETDARKLVADGLARYADDPAMLEQAARFSMELKEYAEADRFVQKALALAPENAELLLIASRLATERGDYSGTGSYAEKAIASAPSNAQAYLNLAFAYERLGRVDDAIALLETMDRTTRLNSPQIYLSLSELYLLQERVEDLAKLVEEYKGAYPEHQLILEYLDARHLMVAEENEPALAKLTTVVESSPDFTRAQFYQAVAMLRLEKREEAKLALERYLRNRPDDVKAKLLYDNSFGVVKSASDLMLSARAVLENAERPSQESLILTARSLLSQSGLAADSEEGLLAEQLLERAIADAPDSVYPYATLLDRLLARQDAERALGLIAKAVENGIPSVTFARQQAALALMREDAEAAMGYYAEDRARPEFTREDAVRWAGFMAGQGKLDKAQAILQGELAAQTDDEGKQALELELIRLARQHGDTDAALRQIDAALAAASADSEWQHTLLDQKLDIARAVARPGEAQDRARGDALIAEIRQIAPEYGGLKIHEARALVDQGIAHLDEALAVGTNVLATDPENPVALMLMAEIYSRKGQYNSSLEYADRTIAADPDMLRAKLAKADVLNRLNRFNEVIALCESVLRDYPDDPVALELITRAYASTRQLSRGQVFYNRLAGLSGGDPEASLRLAELRGLLLSRSEDVTQAAADAQQAYDAAPDNYTALQNLARLKIVQGRPDEALALAKSFAERAQDNFEAWTLVGQLSLSQRTAAGVGEASSAFTRALFLLPDYLPALRGLIEVQSMNRNVGAVIGLCDRFLAVEPASADILYRKAYMLSQTPGKEADALAAVESAVTLDPKVEYRTLRGYLLLTAKRYQEALDDFGFISNSIPLTTASIDAATAECHLALGNMELARQYFDSARRKLAANDTATASRLQQLEPQLQEQQESNP